MDKNTFLEAEFRSLREEVKETKSRIFKTMVAGLTVVPAANVIADTYQVDVLTLSLPVLVLVVGLLYLSENHALMRCGLYIRKHIEPQIPDAIGWETWLCNPDIFKKRATDRFTFMAFYLLYLVYFIGSSWMAAQFAFDNYGMLVASIAAGIYSGLLIWSAIFIAANKLYSTTTSGERVE